MMIKKIYLSSIVAPSYVSGIMSSRNGSLSSSPVVVVNFGQRGPGAGSSPEVALDSPLPAEIFIVSPSSIETTEEQNTY